MRADRMKFPAILKPRIELVLREYEARADIEAGIMAAMSQEQRHQRLDEFLVPVGRATGAFLNLLMKESKSRRILEVGTSYGYSTIWLADAAAANDGNVVTLELQQYKADYARVQLEKAGLQRYVEFRIGDALVTLAALSGPFDFVLVDLWNEANVRAIDLIYPLLSEGALVIADNMIFPEAGREAARAYRDHIRSKRDISSVLLRVGSGIELSRFR